MLEMFLTAFLIGVAMTVPPGPIVITAGRYAITTGFVPSMVFTLGSLLFDFFYAMLVYIGLAPLIADNDLLRLALWIIGGAWLMWLGWDGIRSSVTLQSDKDAMHYTPIRGFVSGAGMTLFNPMTIVGWIALAGSFFANWQPTWGAIHQTGIWAIVSMLVGVMAWMIILCLTLSWLRRYIDTRFIRGLSIVSGIFLIVVGIASWISALEMLFH